MPTLMEMEFRYDNVSTHAERTVMDLKIFLGSIAGLYGFIMMILSYIIGGYCAFLTKLNWFQKLYRVEPKNQDSSIDYIFENDGSIDFMKMNRGLHYCKT